MACHPEQGDKHWQTRPLPTPNSLTLRFCYWKPRQCIALMVLGYDAILKYKEDQILTQPPRDHPPSYIPHFSHVLLFTPSEDRRGSRLTYMHHRTGTRHKGPTLYGPFVSWLLSLTHTYPHLDKWLMMTHSDSHHAIYGHINLKCFTICPYAATSSHTLFSRLISRIGADASGYWPLMYKRRAESPPRARTSLLNTRLIWLIRALAS